MSETSTVIKPAITLEIINSIDIRIGTITAIHEVKNSKKLVKLIVDFGSFNKQILVGMKQEREELHLLIGTQTMFVVNLAPRIMAGEISEGMLLDIGFADGILPALAIPERKVPEGTRVG